MAATFEQASQLLDEAILSYSVGQIEEASQYIASAAATLHEIQLVPSTEPVLSQPGDMNDPIATVQWRALLPAAAEVAAPAAHQPVHVEPAPSPSLAAAA